MRFTPCAIAFLVKRRVGAPSSALGVAAEVMPESLLEAVRRLRAADPDLGVRRLLASLREQQLDLEAGSKEIHLALNALKTESWAKAAAAQRSVGVSSVLNDDEPGTALGDALSEDVVGIVFGRLRNPLEPHTSPWPSAAPAFGCGRTPRRWCTS